MGTCYNCGCSGADYRRTVVTGQSQGVYYGRKSTSFSTRTYTGLRTVCEECAFSIDKGRLVGTIVKRWILALILMGLVLYYKF